MTIQATYEHGVLKPLHPVDLNEGDRIEIVAMKVIEPDAAAIAAIRRSAATPEKAKAALDDVLAIQEKPIEVPYPDATDVGEHHDRYLYGDRSEFMRSNPPAPKSENGDRPK
jgi:predicted DNA-binding antitoxin AbrB/MazE fold protein